MNNSIIEISGAKWKHRLLQSFAKIKDIPMGLRLFYFLKRTLSINYLLKIDPSGLKLLMDITDWVQYQIYFYGNYEKQSISLFKNISKRRKKHF